MPTKIHATAIVHANAELDVDVEVGPFVIVESHTFIGGGTKILARAHIMSGTTLGRDNEIHPGVVLGDAPQDKSFEPETSSFLVIGANNIFRENATFHRASAPGEATRIGDRGFFMGNSHGAHDVVIGNDVVVCNNTVLAGHVQVNDGAFISGNVVVHQFTRIGNLCMLGGGCGAGQDAPPFTTVIGRSQIRGLNNVGMRRAGFSGTTRSAIKKLYGAIFAARGNFKDVMRVVASAPDLPELNLIRDFYQAKSKRGFMWPPARNETPFDQRHGAEESS